MGWKEDDVEVDGIRLHVYRRGSGIPVLVAHGFSDCARQWTGAAKQLEDEFEIVAYDARCHGLSDKVGFEDDRSGGDDMVGVALALGLDRPFIMGHSMGAMTTFIAALRRPDLFRGAVLEDPGFGLHIPKSASGEEDREALRQSLLAGIAARNAVPFDDEVAATLAARPTWDEDDARAWVDARRRFEPAGEWSGAHEAAVGWRQLVADLAIPVLLVRGEPSKGSIVTAETAAFVQAASPNVEVAAFDTSHSIKEEQLDGFVARVRQFFHDHS